MLKGFFGWCSPKHFSKLSSKASTHRSACPLDSADGNGAGSVVIDLVWYAEVFELSRCKLASIARQYGVYYTKPSEQLWRNVHGGFCDWVFISMYFGLLWETVDNNEIVKFFQRASEVNVYHRPWKFWLWPGVEFDRSCLNNQGTAICTVWPRFQYLCPCFVKKVKATHQTFHPITPWMASVKIFQNTFLQYRWKHDAFSVK